MTKFMEGETKYNINLLDDADIFNANVLASVPFDIHVKSYIEILPGSPFKAGSTAKAGDTITFKARIHNPDHLFDRMSLFVSSNSMTQNINIISVKDADGRELFVGSTTMMLSRDADSTDLDIIVETPFTNDLSSYTFRLHRGFFFWSVEKEVSINVSDPATSQNAYLREFRMTAQNVSFPGGFADISGNQVFANNQAFANTRRIDMCYGVATMNNGFFPSLLSFKERTTARGFSFPTVPSDARNAYFRVSNMTARQFYTSSDATLSNLSVSAADVMLIDVNQGEVVEMMTAEGRKGLILVHDISEILYPASLSSTATVRVKMQR